MRLVAGPPDASELRLACALVRVTYGDSLALFRHLHGPVLADLSPFPRARAAFEAILTEQASGALGSTALTEALMRECLIYLLRHLSQTSNPPLPWLTALDDPGLARVLEALLTNPAAPHSVASIADKAMMSRSAFATRFHAAFGYPPLTFLHDLRLRQAADLLQQSESLSVDQIAHRVGFGSRSHFSQAFKARFGAAPTTYRAAASQQA